MIDAHTHVHDLEYLKYLKEHKVKTIISTSNIQQYEFIKEYLDENIYFSIGIHPWYADKSDFDKLIPVLDNTKILGEIGMDNEWCDTDLNIQKEVFIKQLEYALNNCKKVVLHTKAMEKEILDIIKQYPNTYMVHWYDNDKYLDEYIKLGAYFTIGPDLKNPNIIELIKKVPIDRLLTESDGLASISWVNNTSHTSYIEYSDTLNKMVETISELKNMNIETVKQYLNENFERFVK